MRKRVLSKLDDALARRLKLDWPSARRLDANLEAFNGVIGFELGALEGRNLFLAIVPHEETDAFRVNVAWGLKSTYPERPFCDTLAGIDAHLGRDEAEVQLADFDPANIPYEFDLDPDLVRSKRAQARMFERMQRGEVVAPDEWIASLHGKACALEEAVRSAEVAASSIGDSVGRIFLGR